MSTHLDLNADLGEHPGPPPPAALALLRLVTSANVACGGHAGDDESMRETIAQAARLGVQIGAHPSYPDPEGFGRRVLAMSPDAIAESVAQQVDALCVRARDQGARVRHVKPHGALYNTACHDRTVADAIVAGIVRVDASLALYAPHGSALADAGAAAALRVIAEGFLDRAYEDDGTLTPRGTAGAVLHDPAEASRRAVAWARTGKVIARSGRVLRLPIGTLCVHGDTPDAAAIAASVRAALTGAGIRVARALERYR